MVYKVTCRECDEFYIGNTQQKMKIHQRQHLNDVKKLVLRGESLDSFADHFLRHCAVGVKLMNEQLRRIMKHQILWQVNPISCMKTFRKLNCALIMHARESGDFMSSSTRKNQTHQQQNGNFWSLLS